LTYLFTLGIQSEENSPKMENQQLVSPSRQCFSAPVGFGQRFLGKQQCGNNGASPISDSSQFLTVPSTETSIEGMESF
jgi:hypothetical protein